MDFVHVCLSGVCCNTKAGCVSALMQQGKIYESAGVVFWREKRCVTIAGLRQPGDCLTSQSRYAGFLTLLQCLTCLLLDTLAN